MFWSQLRPKLALNFATEWLMVAPQNASLIHGLSTIYMLEMVKYLGLKGGFAGIIYPRERCWKRRRL
jgi:hypothetical protein